MIVTTVEDAQSLQHLLVDSSLDADLRERLLGDPRTTLMAAGVNVRSDIEVRPVESNADVLYVVLPVAPEEGVVPDDELDGATGGGTPVFLIPLVPIAITGIVLATVAINNAIVEGGGESA